LLIFQWLQADACLANTDNHHPAAFSSSRLVLLIGESDPDLRDAVRGEWWRGWAAENRGLLVVDVDARAVSIGACSDCQTAVVRDGLAIAVHRKLLSGYGSVSANLAHGVKSSDQEKRNEDQDHEGNEEVNHGR